MKTHIVPFHGETITAIETQDGIYVPLLPLCARLGIARQPQQAKLKSDPERWGSTIIVLPSAGGEQETLCIPVNRIAAWLFTLNAKKLKPEAREALVAYQREAADVLDRHFRLRQREAEAELAKVKAQLEICVAFACSFNDTWARIRNLQGAKIERAQIYPYFGARPKKWLDVIHEQMESAGAIRMEDWPDGASYRLDWSPQAKGQPKQGELPLTPVEAMQDEMARQFGEG